MSRTGNAQIDVPNGVKVEQAGPTVSVSGPLGKESWDLIEGIAMKVEENVIQFSIADGYDQKKMRPFHGLCRSLVNNMVTGVSQGFEKELEIIGVGYRVQQQGADVVFQLGYSHPINFKAPEGITIEVIDQTKLKVKGSNKQAVGQVAANIRELRPPEPYKGKGIRYKDEYVIRKAGKSGK